ncbi:MAG: MFS transporter [Pseudomonadota bacterium]
MSTADTKKVAPRAIWGWMMFDWASQPYFTLLLTFIFAPYFTSAVAPDEVSGQVMWANMQWMAAVPIALLAPVLGAIADDTGPRKPWIAAFSVLFVIGAGGLWMATPGVAPVWPILALFALGLIGAEFATTFNNAMLPGLGPREDVGRISGSGWALGYAGGVVALALCLALLAENAAGLTLIGIPPILGLDAEAREGTRAVGIFTALWYILFMIPFFLLVPDVPRRRVSPEKAGPGTVVRSLRALAASLRSLPSRGSFSAFLFASMFYRDALSGIFIFGGIYAAGVLGWSIIQIGIFGILAAVVGAIGAYLGGRADGRYGPRPVIFGSVLMLIALTVAVVLTTPNAVIGVPVPTGSNLPDLAFYLFGALIGAAGGALQAASRTMLTRQAEPGRMTEAFGLYALAGKATAFLAPLMIAIVTETTGSQRLGVTPVIALFTVGLILLFWVSRGEETVRHNKVDPHAFAS